MPPKTTRSSAAGGHGSHAQTIVHDPMLVGTYADESHAGGGDAPSRASKAAEREEAQEELARFEAKLGGGAYAAAPSNKKAPQHQNRKLYQQPPTDASGRPAHAPPMRASFESKAPPASSYTSANAKVGGPAAASGGPEVIAAGRRAGQRKPGAAPAPAPPTTSGTSAEADPEEEQERRAGRQADIAAVRRLSALPGGGDSSSSDDE